jgi:hypothetical protein
MLDQAQLDISGLNFQQLEELRNRLEQRVTEMREVGAPALREQWGQQAAEIGMTMEEIVEGAKGRRGRPKGGRNGEAD